MSNTMLTAKQKTILVVDDNKGILDVMRVILEHSGYIATTTNDGRYLIHMKQPLPDLIFLDIMLSGTDGRELCKLLKADEKTKHMPVLILSANNDIAEISKNCGADGYLSKPFDMKHMLDLVELHTRKMFSENANKDK